MIEGNCGSMHTTAVWGLIYARPHIGAVPFLISFEPNTLTDAGVSGLNSTMY